MRDVSAAEWSVVVDVARAVMLVVRRPEEEGIRIKGEAEEEVVLVERLLEKT